MQTSDVRRLLLATLAVLAVCLGFAASALGAFEAALNPSGAAYEINPDDDGLLWISDYDAGQVWGLYLEEGYFEIYPVMGAPSDARHADGWLWWADGEDNILGRVSTLDGALTRWEVPGAAGFYGTAVDAEGRLWAANAHSAILYRLDADQGELCTFTLPSGGMSSYIIRDAGSLWLGDWVNERLLRLTVDDNHLTWWSLPTASEPFGMAVDGQGNLWYADQGRSVLARLDPTAGELASYAQPEGTLPAMVAVQGDLVWYTEHYLASLDGLDPGPRRSSQKQDSMMGTYSTGIGCLDPQTASYTVSAPAVESTDLAPDCASISPSSSEYATITVEDVAWSPATYSTVLDENGWRLYQLPEESFPWGIANTTTVWFVDTNRHVLGRISPGVQVTACKLEDADGDLATTADQTPVEGWTMHLLVDGQAQEPGQATGEDGCVTWSDLAPGVAYGVEEEMQSGWRALTPTSVVFDPALSGASYAAEFINSQEAYRVYLPLITK